MRASVHTILLPLLLAGCSGGEPDGNEAQESPAAAQPSLFRVEIAPVLQQNCAICHLTGEEAGEMSLVPDRARASLVDVEAVGAKALKRVVPGDPDASYLVKKLEGTHIGAGGSGARMPFGAPPLPPETIGKIRQWIADGAKP